MDTTGIIIFSIVMLHLLAGFGYMAYKLAPKKKDTRVTGHKPD
jgi:general stress protein CsbA